MWPAKALTGGSRGQSRGVIDGNMHIFPTDTVLVALAGAVTADTMADAVNPADPPGVDMDEFAWALALIVHGSERHLRVFAMTH